MKIKEILLDAATVVGCCVGVGFLSGKEAQVFFGNAANVFVFAACFASLNILVRSACTSNGCYTLAEFSESLFGKLGKAFSALFCFCCFVCMVTMLAGVESCLGQILFQTKFPVYALISAIIATVILKKGLNALKWLNIVSLSLAALCVIILAAKNRKISLPNTAISPLQPIKYAFFSVTMSLGVLTELSRTNKKQNNIATGLATTGLCVLIVIVLLLGDFSESMPMLGKTDSAPLNLLICATMLLATVTGVVANTIPILECTDDIFDKDTTLAAAVTLTLAVALSMFGFDFALEYGYLFVAAVGVTIFVALCVQKIKTLSKKSILKIKAKDKKRTPTS